MNARNEQSKERDWKHAGSQFCTAMRQFRKELKAAFVRQPHFDDLMALSADLSTFFVFKGLKPGDRVLVHLADPIQFSVVRIAALRTGMTVCTFANFDAAETLSTPWPRAMIVGSDMTSEVSIALNRLPIQTVICAQPTDLHGGMRRFLSNNLANLKRSTHGSAQTQSGISLRGAFWAGNLLRQKSGQSKTRLQ